MAGGVSSGGVFMLCIICGQYCIQEMWLGGKLRVLNVGGDDVYNVPWDGF